MEIFETTTYACSPFRLLGADLGARDSWTATGHEVGVRVLAPVVAAAQGTGLSSAMRTRTDVATAAKANALLPTSVTVDIDGVAGIRSWSPPV